MHHRGQSTNENKIDFEFQQPFKKFSKVVSHGAFVLPLEVPEPVEEYVRARLTVLLELGSSNGRLTKNQYRRPLRACCFAFPQGLFSLKTIPWGYFIREPHPTTRIGVKHFAWDFCGTSPATITLYGPSMNIA
jgi:hypothetical protein